MKFFRNQTDGVLSVSFKIIIEGIIVGLLTVVCTKPSYAQVIINEVMPAPSSGSEWVELKNLSTQSLSLTGWKAEDRSGALVTSPLFAQSSIPSQGYFVFEVNNRLNNSGDDVVIRRPDLSVADFFQYTSSEADKTWARLSDSAPQFVLSSPSRGLANLVASPSATPSPSPTPSPSVLPSPLPSSPVVSPSPSAVPSVSPSPSSVPSATPNFSVSPNPSLTPIPTPTPTPSASPFPSLSPFPTVASPSPSPFIYQAPLLSEVVSCPESGQPEWIEFFNPNNQPLSIQNWKIQDSTGNTRTLNMNMNANSYFVFELSSSLLNNDGDSLEILDQFATPLFQLDLPACSAGQSTIFVNSSWQQTTTATKGTANVFTTDHDQQSPPVFESLGSLSTAFSPAPISFPAFPEFNEQLLTSNQQTQPVQSHSVESAAVVSPEKESLFQLPDLGTPTVEPAVLGVSTDTKLEGEMNSKLDSGASAQNIPNSTSSTDKQPTSQPFFISKPILLLLFFVSFLCLAAGGFGIYQWYTERRVEAALEIL